VTLALLAGAELAASASEGPQTQASPSAYTVVARTINDAETFKPRSNKKPAAELPLVISSFEQRK
jgi:hypothetical protein